MYKFKEELLHFIWQHKLLKPEKLQSQTGQLIKIINQGEINKDSGPDFFNAKIKLGELILAGNIEIHIKASDWFKHKHHLDKNYESIILHVVYQNDLSPDQLKLFPFETLEIINLIDEQLLNKYSELIGASTALACSTQLHTLASFNVHTWLDRMLIERLESRMNLISKYHEETNHDYRETFYRLISRNFGFKVNAEPFEALSRYLPLSIISKHSDNLIQLEALLYGTAGFLEKSYTDKYIHLLQNEFEFLKQKYQIKTMNMSTWKFMRLRPLNFPTVRLWQFALLLNKCPDLFSSPQLYFSFEKLKSKIQFTHEGYWKNHYSFEGSEQMKIGAIGNTSIENLIINSIAPFLFFYGKQIGREEYVQNAIHAFENIEFEVNSKTKLFMKAPLNNKSSSESQALIHLYDNYCKSKSCLNCGIAAKLLVN